MSTTDGRKNNGAKAKYKERVQLMFPVEKETRELVRKVPGLQDKFNAWVQSILNEQER